MPELSRTRAGSFPTIGYFLKIHQAKLFNMLHLASLDLLWLKIIKRKIHTVKSNSDYKSMAVIHLKET